MGEQARRWSDADQETVIMDIAQLADRGYCDDEIGIKLGLTRGQVWWLRTSRGIAGRRKPGGAQPVRRVRGTARNG